MHDLPVHTLIGHENQEGGLLLCGINHGYSKNDERLDSQGIDSADESKSFFSDNDVNDYPFRNRIVTWFSLWGYEFARTKEKAGPFEKSIVQTNWLQTCSNNMHNTNTQQLCIEDADSFLQTCDVLKPRLVFFFGRELFGAFTSDLLKSKVEAIFGKRLEDVMWLQKNVLYNGKPRRRFRFGFIKFENMNAVVLPHATGAQGIADDYIKEFKPEMGELIDSWWSIHKENIIRRKETAL